MTTYLKYKFKRGELEVSVGDLEYLLPKGRKLFTMFQKAGKDNKADVSSIYQTSMLFSLCRQSPTAE
jgi:hypothetical protein